MTLILKGGVQANYVLVVELPVDFDLFEKGFLVGRVLLLFDFLDSHSLSSRSVHC